MVRAVREGVIDGIGLGRPAVSETDIAKKLLFDGIRSVAVNNFESNFKLSVVAATTQMFQVTAYSLSLLRPVSFHNSTSYTSKLGHAGQIFVVNRRRA